MLEGSFASYPASTLDSAWLNLTLDDHGLAGEPTPKHQGLPEWLVNDNSPDQWDMLYREKWAASLDAGYDMLDDALIAIAELVQPGVDSSSFASASTVVVFNTLSWARSEPVTMLLPSGVTSPVVVDAESGQAVQVQLVAASSPPQMIISASDVPAFGYRTYLVSEASKQAEKPVSSSSNSSNSSSSSSSSSSKDSSKPQLQPGDPWTAAFSNNYYRITPGKGGISSLVDLQSGQELFDTTHYDAGEWMQLEYVGMGASETRVYPSPTMNAHTFQRLGDLPTPLNWTCIESGPVRTVFQTNLVPTAHSAVQLTLEVAAQTKQLDLRVVLENWDSAFGVVNRVVFPIKTDQRNVSYAVPYGVVRVGEDEAEDGYNDVVSSCCFVCLFFCCLFVCLLFDLGLVCSFSLSLSLSLSLFLSLSFTPLSPSTLLT